MLRSGNQKINGNQKIAKREASEPATRTLLGRAGVMLFPIACFAVLSIALVVLAIGGYLFGKDSIRKSRRFSTT